jgi:hypothetical protein
VTPSRYEQRRRQFASAASGKSKFTDDQSLP